MEIQKILNDYNLSLKDAIIITDEETTALDEFTHNKCIINILNNVVETSLKKVKELESFLQQCLRVKQYYTDSYSSTLFNNISPTKWNAVYEIVNTIQQNLPEIKINLQQNNMLSEFNSLNNANLQSIIKLLKPFENVSKILENEDRPTIHLVYALMNGLKGSLSNGDDYCEETMQQFRGILKEQLQTTVVPNLSITHKIALFLFPPANKLILFSENEKCFIKTTIATYLKAYDEHNDKTPEFKKDLSATFAESNTILSSYLKDVITKSTEYNCCDPISNEIHTYESFNVLYNNKFDILQWWSLHKKQFPLLYKLSCKILATPASCASSETIVSLVRHVAQNYGVILSSPKEFNQMLFLNLSNFEINKKMDDCTISQLNEGTTTIENT